MSAASLGLRIEPTPGLSGFTTFTFAIQSGAGESLRGVDAAVTGPLGQVNPLGVPTVFSDNNGVFPFIGADVRQDSQFLFDSGDVLSIGAVESAAGLSGAISGIASLGLPNPVDFVQVVTDQPRDVDYDFAFDLGGREPARFSGPLCELAGCIDLHTPGGAVVVETTSAPGLPGFVTRTVFLKLASGSRLRAVDAEFLGNLYQSHPDDMPTAFLPDPAGGSAHAADSRFLFLR